MTLKRYSEYNHYDTFQGIGCFQDNSTGEETEFKLEMDPKATRAAQKPHPVTCHLQKSLRVWLEQGVKENTIEKVPDGETITWCWPEVVQLKPKYADIKTKEFESQLIRETWNQVDWSTHQDLKILSTAWVTARSSGNWTWDKSITNWH